MSLARARIGTEVAITWLVQSRVWQVIMRWTPNKVTFLRVLVGFAAVCLFGRGAWANLTAVGLRGGAMALDALGGQIGREKKMGTPVGAALVIRGDRVI